MKKLVKNVMAVALAIAATMMNNNSAFASNSYADTLDDGNRIDSSISPDEEDAEEEQAIALEDWMFEEIEVAEEQPIALEDWMFEEVEVAEEQPIALEDWMFE